MTSAVPQTDLTTPLPDCETATALGLPVYEARHLTRDGAQALIRLEEQIYMLRITKNGKLILTK